MKRFNVALLLACLSAFAAARDARAEDPNELVIQRGTDPATGAELTLFRGDRGLTGLTVRTADVSVRREFVDGRGTTTIRSGSDTLSIEFDLHRLVVSNGLARVEATRDARDRMEAARALIGRSEAGRAAAALIGQLGIGQDSPVRLMLLSTRALLLSAVNDQSGLREIAAWTARARSSASVVRIGLGQTPNECWNTYTGSVIPAYDEFQACIKDLAWYEWIDRDTCLMVYELRVIGAAAWYVRCVGIGA